MNRYLNYLSVFFIVLLVSCSKESSFEKGKIAQGSLQGAGGDCLTKNVVGTYAAGKSLMDSNYIEVDVDVTETGRFTIYSDTVNGYFFRGTGNFSAPGTYTVRIKGSGNPDAEGTDDFLMFFDSSFCNVSVTVGPNTGNTGNTGGSGGTTSGDYFPLTQNSFWSYDDGAGGDTTKVTVSGAAANGGKTYQRFITTYESGDPNDTAFYRKDNTGSYYTTIDTSFFFGLVTFAQPTLDVLFLKNSLTTGATWNSDFAAKAMGQNVTARFKFTCANANASVTANGVTYNNVYKITAISQLIGGGTTTDLLSLPDTYYAKGVGLIQSLDPLFGDDHVIRHYKVL